MIKDYKGEKPNNVITKEEHQKRPFFKKASFWILSVLGLFFGACTIYGLVLGYQYVGAVREAAHIIADAQSDEMQSQSFKKNRQFAYPYNENVAVVDLGTLNWNSPNATGWITTENGVTLAGAVVPDTNNDNVSVLCAGYKTGSPNFCYTTDYSCSMSRVGQPAVRDPNLIGLSTVQAKAYFAGKMFYYATDGSVDPASKTFYDEGYAEGHLDGYQEGYDDGYQALAGVQNVRILFDENFPTLNPINYSWKVDDQDVASGQIMLRPNQSAPVVNLTRPGGYTHKATLNIWSENDEPLIIAYGRHEGLVIGGTQTYIYDTYNKSNAYDWANSVWYVPTYNPNAGFVIYSYATAQQGYTNDYFFEFDPEHNDRAKTGIYAEGYHQGYKDGTESGTAYDNGHQDGYAQGYEDGLTIGKAQGEAQAVGGQKALVTMFVTAFQQPFDQIYRFLNFNVLGLNILALFTALLTLSIGIIIIKKVI